MKWAMTEVSDRVHTQFLYFTISVSAVLTGVAAPRPCHVGRTGVSVNGTSAFGCFISIKNR